MLCLSAVTLVSANKAEGLPFKKTAKGSESSTGDATDASKKSSEKKHEEKQVGSKIGVNDKAPDVALPDQNGKTVSLKDFQGQKVVVLYFYPKDNTSVCTAEACTFRDSYDAFKQLGAEVIGVSSDSADSHKKFAEKNHLQFSLLADTSNMARKAFGVPSTAAVIPGRVTYVIDKSGVVRYTFNSMMDGAKHVTEAMRIVKELNEKPSAQ